MNFWAQWSPEHLALAFVGLIAAMLMASLLVRSILDSANARVIPWADLKRDQVQRERRRQLRIQQRGRRSA